MLIFCVAAVHGLLAILSVRAFGPLEGLLWPSALLCAAHWSALGIFVQRFRWPIVGKWIALTCLGWWIPALLTGANAWERVSWALAPVRHVEFHTQSVETSLAVLVDTIPLVAWWVAAALLPTPRAIKR